MAGLRCTLSPPGRMHLKEQTRTPRQLFLRMCTLWLLVFLMAQPLACLLASSLLAGYTSLQWPSAHSEKGSNSEIRGTEESLMSQSVDGVRERQCGVMVGDAGLCLEPKTSPSQHYFVWNVLG